MPLSELIDGIATARPREPDPVIAGLTAHSAAVQPGFLFAAFKGSRADGAEFVREALARGAAAILAGKGARLGDVSVPVVRAESPRAAWARIAARFYGAQPETVVAVTGTNGKTSVASFVRQIWENLGHRAASIGTLGVRGALEEPLAQTTPEPVLLHRILADLAHAGVQHAAVEASSHGLDQHRLSGTRIAAAGFTNLSRDHLDYHGDAESYLAAKTRLFTEVLAPDGVAVLNADAPEFPGLATAARSHGHRVWSYGRHGADLRVVGHRPNGAGQYLEFAANGGTRTIRIPLVGEFQAWNAMCAAGLVAASGTDMTAALDALAALKVVPGRMQEVAEHNGARVFVDYAHTPDALERVLRALRPHARHHLTVVFGCGGDRDRGKRPLMGRVASDLADRVIVTDDNPRGEEPAAIRAAVMAGCRNGVEIADRAEAIRAAIAGLDEGDVLVIAGKGHESGQVVGDRTIPFDDATEARTAATSLAEAAA